MATLWHIYVELNSPETTAIRANLEALNALLQEAAARVAEAAHYITEGEQNAAIGTVVGLDQTLESAQKLLGAAFALHRA